MVLIQLANLRAAHMKATSQATHQNVERLEAELSAVRSEQHAAMEEHRRLAEQHSETLKMMEDLTNSRKKLEQELELERNLRKKAEESIKSMERASSEAVAGSSAEDIGTFATKGTGNDRRYTTSRGSSGSSRGSSRTGSRHHSVDDMRSSAASSNLKVRPGSKGRGRGSIIAGVSDSAAHAVLKKLGKDSIFCSIPHTTWNEWIKRARAINLELDDSFEIGNEKKKEPADATQGQNNGTGKTKEGPKKKFGGDENNVFGYLDIAQNMATNPVSRLVQKALESMEIDSGLDAAAIEASKGGKSKKKTPFATSKSGVPIQELRRLMNRPPPWKQPAAGALRGERKDSMTVNTSEETGITDFRSNDEGESKKKKGKKKGDDTRMSYFVGRGTGDDVPAFLRFNGRVRNRHLSKGQVERIVRTVWVRKEQQRNKDKLSDFFLNEYLKKDFGPSMTIVVEQAYNIVHALERYQNDADCDMFLKILMGSLPEQAFVDQQLLLRRVQVGVESLSQSLVSSTFLAFSSRSS